MSEVHEKSGLILSSRGGRYLDPARDLEKEINKGIALSKKVNTTSFSQIKTFKVFIDEVAEERTSYMLYPFEGEKNTAVTRNLTMNSF